MAVPPPCLEAGQHDDDDNQQRVTVHGLSLACLQVMRE
jgi:hypothetical protein